MRIAGIVVSLLFLVFVSTAAAQRPAPAGRGTASPAANTPAAPATFVQERELRLSRVQLERMAKAQASANPAANEKEKEKGGLLGALKGVMGSNDAKLNAARVAQEVTEAEAAAVANRETRTVIVIVGNDEERIRVRDSLATVQRPVVLMWLNTDHSDAVSDNTGLRATGIGQVAGLAANVWVFQPSAQAVADAEPTQRLSSRGVSPTVWSGLALTGGNGAEATNVAAGIRARPAADSAQDPRPAGTAGTAGAATAARFSEGDVVAPKIANVRIMAQPADDSKAVATLARTDELVIVGAERNGFINVQSATASGWVKAALVEKR